jgi:hypothetical protein
MSAEAAHVTEPTAAPTSTSAKTVLQATHACVLPDPKTYEGAPLGEYFMECKECQEVWSLERKVFSRRLVWSTIVGGSADDFPREVHQT